MKIKNEYVKIKQGKNEVELHNLILDKYLSLFASSVLETKYKGLNSCLINCTIQEEITPSMDAMHWDFYLNEQNLYNNSDYKGASKIITKYLYEPNFKEQIQSFIGQKILSIGFAQMVEEPTLPDGSDATFELYAILDVSNYNLYVQDMQEFVVERVDTVTTDMVFSSDTEKFPIHLSPRGNSYFDQQEETGTREVGILNAIGKGYNSMFPTALMPKSNFNITRNENEIDITGLSIQENTGEELYPSNELYPKKKWSEEIQKSEKGSEVIIEGNNKEAFVDIEGKSVQNGTPSPSNPSEIHSVADDVNLFDASKIANSSMSVTDNGKTIIMPLITRGNGNTNTATKLNVLCPDLQVGDVIYIRFKRNLNNNRNKFIYLYGSNKIMYASENRPSYTITQEDLNSYVFLYGNDYDYGETEQCIITDFKIQKNKITPYSPYNQGTVTIKQRGKNYFNANANTKPTIQVSNNGAIIKLNTSSLGGGAVNGEKLSVLAPDLVVGETYKLSLISSKSNLQYIYVGSLWISGTTKIITQEMLDSTTVFYSTSSEEVTITDMQIVKENEDITNWEPYQTPHDYIIQTEPLRSLPNGVKDTIEADGIHRKVGRVVLDGSENWTNKNITDNNILFSSFKIDNLFNTTNLINLTSNYFNVNSSLWTNDNEGVCLFNMKASLRFRINKNLLNNISTVENAINSMKTWLSTHNTEVLYPLAEEIIEPFTEEQMEVLRSIQTFDGYNNFTTTDDLQPVIQVTEYENCVYPQKAQMNWIFYQYGIYKFIDTVTGYEYTGRLYREAKNTNKSGNLSLKIKYERGE